MSIHNFTFHKTSIDGVVIARPAVFGDSRGYFMETYRQEAFVAGGIPAVFVQDNQSKSVKNVLRGLHFQKKYPQAKLVRVLSGEVFDVCVDLRKGSPTYGQWFGEILSAENRKQLYIPRGCAHGFLVLSDSATFAYKCDDYYRPDDEGGLLWNDPALGIEWPLTGKPILSEKDLKWPGIEK